MKEDIVLEFTAPRPNFLPFPISKRCSLTNQMSETRSSSQLISLWTYKNKFTFWTSSSLLSMAKLKKKEQKQQNETKTG